MKNEMAFRELLHNKFDELAIPATAAKDWKQMEKTLQIAMPVGLLAMALHWKLWLTKKMLWTGLLIFSGSTAALIVYHERQASLATSANTAKVDKKAIPAFNNTLAKVQPQLKGSQRGKLPIVNNTLTAVKDTDTVKTYRNATLTKGKGKRKITAKSLIPDSIARAVYARKHRIPIPVADTISHLISKHKKPMPSDTVSRPVYARKQKMTVKHSIDSASHPVNKHKSLPPRVKDTIIRQHKLPPFGRP